MNFNWANARNALKNAQKKIDRVLDIREDENSPSTDGGSLDDLSIDVSTTETITAEPVNTEKSPFGADAWSTSWGTGPNESEVVVDSEPNPIRDEGVAVPALLDHSPSSNSSEGAELPCADSEEKKEDEVEKVKPQMSESSLVQCGFDDVDLKAMERDESSEDSRDMIREEPVLPPHPDASRLSRRSSRHDDSMTVASSDIEVVRNVDAWSIASSKIEHGGTVLVAGKVENCDSIRAQLLHAEQRRNELKTANSVLEKTNSQLQHRIIVLNQQQSVSKKELESKKAELEELMNEGKRLSEHSGKLSKELRRVKNELSEMEKIKSERKRLKEEKTELEESVQLQQEEINSLKGIIQNLEATSEQLKKEHSLNTASTEVVQRHIDDQARRISDLEESLSSKNKELIQAAEEKQTMSLELEKLKSEHWAERLAGERANQTAASADYELREARSQAERLSSQLKEAELKLEQAQLERGNVADVISRANAPLLEEINEMRLSLLHEQEINEEAETKIRDLTTELNNLKKDFASSKEAHRKLVNQHQDELHLSNERSLALQNNLEKLRADSTHQLEQLSKTIAANKSVIDTLKNDKLTLVEENENTRKNLKEFKSENDALKESINELKKQKERSERSMTPLQTPAPEVSTNPTEAWIESQNGADEMVSRTLPLDAYRMTQPNTVGAAQIELEAMSLQYNSSLKRLGVLERDAARCAQLEKQIETLRQEQKTLTQQYNQLLEVDGERLEKIEELQQDIIDLRQLLKEQLLVFAEVNSTNKSAE